MGLLLSLTLAMLKTAANRRRRQGTDSLSPEATVVVTRRRVILGRTRRGRSRAALVAGVVAIVALAVVLLRGRSASVTVHVGVGEENEPATDTVTQVL